MLRPVALQGAIQALIDAPDSPADLALLVLSESGGIYAQAHRRQQSQRTHVDLQTKAGPSRMPLRELQEVQLQHQPGLTTLMPSIAAVKKGSKRRRAANGHDTDVDTMSLGLSRDERAHVVAGVACQSWTEELSRVRRLRTGIQGRFPVSPATDISALDSPMGRSVSGTSSVLADTGRAGSRPQNHAQTSAKRGARDADLAGQSEIDIEQIDAPVAIVGSSVPSSSGPDNVAPLVLETELGAMLVMPLSSSEASTLPSLSHSVGLTAEMPLLLVLASYPRSDSKDVSQATASTATQLPALGSSILSQAEWNTLHESAQSFADVVSPALRLAFGTARLAHDIHDVEDAHATESVAALDATAQPATSNGQASRARKVRGAAHAGTGTDTRASTTVFSDDRESTTSVGPGNDHSGLSF